MTNNNSNSDKSGGVGEQHDEKPALIVTENGERLIDAAHHVVSKKKDIVLVYYARRDGGADETLPLHRIETIARSATARELAHDTHGESETRGNEDVVEEGDVVTVHDEDRAADPGPWKVEDINPVQGVARLWSSMQRLRKEPVEDLNVVEKAKDTSPPVAVPGRDDATNGGDN